MIKKLSLFSYNSALSLGTVAVFIMGAIVFPLISRAFFPDELRKIHEQSKEERDMRREQFKQDILEKRKVIFAKWHDKKEAIKDKLKQEQERIKSGFDMPRIQDENLQGTSSAMWGALYEDEKQTGSFLSAVKKGVQNVAHALLPFPNLFGLDVTK